MLDMLLTMLVCPWPLAPNARVMFVNISSSVSQQLYSRLLQLNVDSSICLGIADFLTDKWVCATETLLYSMYTSDTWQPCSECTPLVFSSNWSNLQTKQSQWWVCKRDVAHLAQKMAVVVEFLQEQTSSAFPWKSTIMQSVQWSHSNYLHLTFPIGNGKLKWQP